MSEQNPKFVYESKFGIYMVNQEYLCALAKNIARLMDYDGPTCRPCPFHALCEWPGKLEVGDG